MNKKRVLLIILICSVVTLIIYCVNRPTREDDGKWSWSEENTDNGGITKRISKCWYYYEAWF